MGSGGHGRDGASGHQATVIGLTNLSANPCTIPDVRRLWGIDPKGERVAASKGSYFPIASAPSHVVAGDRVEFVVDSERLDDCSRKTTSRLVTEIGFELTTGQAFSVGLAEKIEAGCRLAYGDVGAWD